MLSRRSFSVLAVGAAFCSPTSARAQTYPERPIRMLIGFPPGGTVDTIGRIIAPALSARLKQPVIIENRGGAAGTLAVEAAARAQPDGYTIVFASAGALVIVPHMQSNLRYDPFKDLAPISRVVGTQMVLVVGKHVKANTAKELQEYAKANPGRMTFGSTGSGSSVHLAGELFKMRAGIDVLHVPYRGGAPAVTALLAGEIDMLVVDLPVVASHIQSGAFKALGVASEQRSKFFRTYRPSSRQALRGSSRRDGMRCTLRPVHPDQSSLRCMLRLRTSWPKHPSDRPSRKPGDLFRPAQPGNSPHISATNMQNGARSCVFLAPT